jgi:hypothetical protein
MLTTHQRARLLMALPHQINRHRTEDSKDVSQQNDEKCSRAEEVLAAIDLLQPSRGLLFLYKLPPMN